MVAGRAVLLLAFGLASGTLSACGEVIGLGDEPEPALTAEICKLPPARKPACTECMIRSACAQSKDCAANAECAEAAANCLSQCWEPTCPTKCLEGLGADAQKRLTALMIEGRDCHVECLPAEGSECEALAGGCCSAIEDPVEKRACVDTALVGDEAKCVAFHQRALESYCPPPGS